LGARLFAILTLLGAVAVLVTGILGYVRARDALELAIYNQLTTAREIKARQVETYFRNINAELRLLATSKMVVESTREFRAAFNELDREPLADEMRQKVSDWYGAHFLPEISRVLGKEPPLADYLPVGSGATYLQYHYIVANPHTAERRRLLDDAGDGSRYSRLHATYHPLMRGAATILGFDDFMIADAKSGRLIYAVDKEVDFATSTQSGPYRNTNVAAAVARCRSSEVFMASTGVIGEPLPEQKIVKVLGKLVGEGAAGNWGAAADDIMTTGASLQEAARALLQAGASRVVGVVLARTPEVS